MWTVKDAIRELKNCDIYQLYHNVDVYNNKFNP